MGIQPKTIFLFSEVLRESYSIAEPVA